MHIQVSQLPSAYFNFNKCPIQTHDVANAKFSTNWDETDYSAEEKDEIR